MNNVVKAVRTLRTLSPEEFKLAIALTRSPKVGRPRKISSKPKAKRARKRIEAQPEAV